METMKAHPYSKDCHCEVCVEMSTYSLPEFIRAPHPGEVAPAPKNVTATEVLSRLSGPLTAADAVNHPKHYTSHPSGVECIDITEHYNFNLGNVIKYVWRSHIKGSPLEDLKKARWYLDREISNREKVS